MKTPHPSTLERGPTGTYAGSISEGMGLSAEQKKLIRKTLADAYGPLFIGSIAGKSGIALNTPMLQQAVSDFVTVYLVSTGEAERVEASNPKTGRPIFKGYSGTELGRSLLQKGLA